MARWLRSRRTDEKKQGVRLAAMKEFYRHAGGGHATDPTMFPDAWLRAVRPILIDSWPATLLDEALAEMLQKEERAAAKRVARQSAPDG